MQNDPSFFKKCVLIVTVILPLLLTACAATPRTTALSSASADALERLAADQQQLDQRLVQLQDNLLLLEARFMDQQALIEQLREAAPSAPAAIATVPQTEITPAELYRKAFAAYAAGDYPQGETDFIRFVALFPNNEYVTNARFWLAECYLAQSKYPQAATTFHSIAEDYPRSALAPKALWKEAVTYERSGATQKAAEVLTTLRKRYPGSSEARKPLN
ncbi:MAG: tol-pal system protein YbgF [Desulfuromonadales bacterium]|nr:tol-pal system protein YbgF [Desulfuromonadales bacterium]